MQITNKERQTHLLKQRKLEIKNNGIKVQFYRSFDSSSFPYLEIQQQFLYIIEEWLYSRIVVNVYDIKNYRQVWVLDRNYLYIMNDQVKSYLKDQSIYKLAKNNATIGLLTDALNDVHSRVDNYILQFINNQNTKEIVSQQMFLCQPWMFNGMNQSQSLAIDLVIREKIAFIKGPPGCGKTKTIARVSLIFSYYGYPMIIGGVTNTANMTILHAIINQCYFLNYMPNIVLYISKQLSTENALHPPQIIPLTFRYKIIQNYLLLSEQSNITSQSVSYLLDMFYTDGQMSKSFLSIYYQAIAKIFNQAQIVIITTTSAIKMDIKLMYNQKFKPFIGILDEASQASWADTYCYLVKGVQKMVFIGDDKQLTPTVISQNQVLKQTMFTKLFMKNTKYYRLLSQQYRMHPKISEFPNMYFYNNQLKDGITAQQRQSQIPYFKKYPTSFINCASQELEVIDQHSGKKKYCNVGQIDIIKKILQYFSIQQLPNIGIISPYDLQIREICTQLGQWMLYSGLTVKTCDGYQGSEKDYIILSCVRSNKDGKIGFCNEQNRLNVSLTRARKGIVVIGNVDTFKKYNPASQLQKQKKQQRQNQLQQGYQSQSQAQSQQQKEQDKKTQQGTKNVWKRYFQYLQQKQLILPVQQLQQYPISNNCYLYYHQQYQNTNNQYQQHINNNQQKQKQRVQVIIIDKNVQDQQEIQNQIYREYKKTIRNIMNKLRKLLKNQNQKQQQQQQQISTIRQQVYNTITNSNYTIKHNNNVIHITHRRYQKHIDFTNQYNKEGIDIGQVIEQKIKQLVNSIILQMYQQYNHYKQNILIQQSIQNNIIYTLHKYNYTQPYLKQHYAIPTQTQTKNNEQKYKNKRNRKK